MYESYFGFDNRPFLTVPTLDRYFPAYSIEQAYQTAVRVIERGEGPVTVFGGAGLGKTMCCLRIAESVSKRFEVVTLASSQVITRRALLQSLLYELRMPFRDQSEGELRLNLLERLQCSEEHPTDGLVLMVDEAQSLSIKLLEELRLLTNIVRHGVPRVRLVLCGTMKLEDLLAHPHMESLNQRLAARCYLTPLSHDETARYVQHKVELCGVRIEDAMTRDALEAIYRASDGIPRLIDQVADQALLQGSLERIRPINAAVIGYAWSLLQQLPNPWSDPVPTRSVPSQSTYESDSDFADETVPGMADTLPYSALRSQVDASIEYGALDDAESDTESESEIEFSHVDFQQDPVERYDAETSVTEIGDAEHGDTHERDTDERHSDEIDTEVIRSEYGYDAYASPVEFPVDNVEDPQIVAETYVDPADSFDETFGFDTGSELSMESMVVTESDFVAEESITSSDVSVTSESENLLRAFEEGYDEEFVIPVQNLDNYQELSGIALGDLNHDALAFPQIHNTRHDESIPEADSFLDYRLDTPQNEEESWSKLQLPTLNLSEEAVEGMDEIEHQIEEEMRDLVSNLNLSAMTIEREESKVLDMHNLGEAIDRVVEDFQAPFEPILSSDIKISKSKNNGTVSFSGLEESTSEQEALSDDRDMIILDESPREPHENAAMAPATTSRAAIHPYAQLFSKLRQS